ncbi:MAG TPA: hypothetical protein VNN76_00105 [Bacteroidota bacterium]|nr:hypothetical protein [Bacteroidota bacterium]
MKVYSTIKNTTDYPAIFPFLYGYKAATMFGYTPFGVPSLAGIEFAGPLVGIEQEQ